MLGTRVSKLELIRLQQQSGGAQPVPNDEVHIRPAEYQLPFDPARSHDRGTGCANFSSLPANPPAAAPFVQTIVPNSEDFLASKRLPIAKTRFDASWNRVRRDKLSRSATKPFHGGVSQALLAEVNSWTNARIRYVEDRDLYGVPDYWAPASKTLQRRAGDCEDIAIAKMQLLAALGLNRSDMYLTVVRDLARNADHAVLIVKLEGRHFLLDNSTDTLLDAAQAHDYRPIFSFANGQKWLHGTTMAPKPRVVRSTEPVRVSLIDGTRGEVSALVEPAARY